MYLTKSRETHLLSNSCAFALGVVEQGPTTFQVLQDRLQTFAGEADPQEVLVLAHEIVDKLSKMGILEILEDAP